MAGHLWPLLVLELPDEEQWQAYQRVFVETCVRDREGNAPTFSDWRGRQIKIHRENFRHAFTRNPRFREGVNHSAALDLRRAQRVLWIKEAINACAGTIRLYQEQFREDGRPKRRKLFYVVEEAYVVIFNEPANPQAPLQFVSAYPTDSRDYEREIRRKNGALIEERRPKTDKAANEDKGA